MNLALIPARGGSQRIPRKNIIDFFGRPMIAYTIAAATNSRLFSRIVVSTDDPEIASISKEFGADVVNRPAWLGENDVTVSQVVVDAVNQLDTYGQTYTSVCMLMANCPLRNSTDIQQHYESFQQAPTSQISVVPYQGTYPHWALVKDVASRGKWLFPKQVDCVSQELPQAFCPTGAIWWSRIENLIQTNDFYSEGFRIRRMDLIRGWDIDDEHDLRLAHVFVAGIKQLDGESILEEPPDVRS